MTRHFLILVTCLFSPFLQHCSAPKARDGNTPRAGEPTDTGTVEQDASGGGTNVGTGNQPEKRPPPCGPGDSNGGGGAGGGTGGGANSGNGDDSGGNSSADREKITHGNGGSVVICRARNVITRIELFDFYEAKVVHDWETSLEYTPDPSKTIFEQAIATARHVVDTRWRSIDPAMASNLTERLNLLPSEVRFDNDDMMLQDDPAAEIDIPTGCLREQILTTSEYLSERSYTVRKRYFEHRKFSNLDRAGLILHELLYDMTRKNGATTSGGARYINSVFFADKQNETLMPLEHYFEVMKVAGFPESSN